MIDKYIYIAKLNDLSLPCTKGYFSETYFDSCRRLFTDNLSNKFYRIWLQGFDNFLGLFKTVFREVLLIIHD